MSFNDARFNSHNSYKTSYVKDPNWEWLRRNLVLVLESAPPSSRQRGVRASERGSQLPNLKRSASQYWRAAEQTKCKYTRMFSQYFLTEMRLIFANMYPYVPLRGSNKYKKKPCPCPEVSPWMARSGDATLHYYQWTGTFENFIV